MGSASNLRLAEEEYGIIPRVASHLFDNVQMQEAEDTNSTYRVRIQFLEIYGEEIRDLLEPSNTGKVTIRETPSGGVYVSGAREELVTSADEMLAVLEKGSSGRTTGSTRMNSVSSRSHGIIFYFSFFFSPNFSNFYNLVGTNDPLSNKFKSNQRIE